MADSNALSHLFSDNGSVQHYLLAIVTTFSLSAPMSHAQPESDAPGTVATQLQPILESSQRAPSQHRDQHRHPLETLTFFDVQPHMSVVEIWPGNYGWYTEILAPYLNEKGTFYAAHFNADSSVPFFRKARKDFTNKFNNNEEPFGKVITTTFNPPEYTAIAPAGTVDRVLTFRSVHNWYMRGGSDERVLAALKAFYTALKPGGVLGIVEHRLASDRPLEDQQSSGYMSQPYVIRMAQQAGFVLEKTSDINANPKDTTRHPRGVWTLPPSLRLGDKQRDHYISIGESDRMTLKFRKPI